VELDARKINVSKFDVSLKDSIVTFRIVCSTGTYIRSLAHDLGQLLGCGAYLSSLCRTRIGEFKIEDAWNMEEAERRIRELA
jgi:tRNA pseudouridine55 synthase